MKVDVMLLDGGGWSVYPRHEGDVPDSLLDHLESHATPEDAGLIRVGEWRTLTWPEKAKEAEYELP